LGIVLQKTAPEAGSGGTGMKKWLLAGVALSFLLMAMIPAGLGQEKAHEPYRLASKKIETIQGIVVDAPELKRGGLPQMEYLTLKTVDQGNLIVMLGPSWFVAQHNWKISALDRLEVTGFLITYNNRLILMAQKVKKDKQLMQFRDKSGRPLWSLPLRQK
jgi:hypothetical protein